MDGANIKDNAVTVNFRISPKWVQKFVEGILFNSTMSSSHMLYFLVFQHKIKYISKRDFSYKILVLN